MRDLINKHRRRIYMALAAVLFVSGVLALGTAGAFAQSGAPGAAAGGYNAYGTIPSNTATVVPSATPAADCTTAPAGNGRGAAAGGSADCQMETVKPDEHSESWLLSTLKTAPKSIDRVVFSKASDDVVVWMGTNRFSVKTLGASDKTNIQHIASDAQVPWQVQEDTQSTPTIVFVIMALAFGVFLGMIIFQIMQRRAMKKAGIDPSDGGIGGGGTSGASANAAGKGMTKSGAHVYEPGKVNGPSIDQFIGQEEAVQELMEVADFLKNPEKYAAIGARIPRGVVMQGPPGVGKTFLTRILASMAGVPVYAISGSEFVEMFVGVGAARVRDLFNEAKKRGKCIIFIDEFDAMGGKRGSGPGGNDERNTTLNQLLVEMDGFDPRAGIIVIAATNRLDMLDPAAIRPGRFDRTVTFHNPTRGDREQLLKTYLPESVRDGDVNLSSVAWLTPNASGAVMENIANEAKIHAVRDGRNKVTAMDLDEATAKVTVGARRSGLAKVLTPEEVDVLAWHEGGHALAYVLRSGKAPLRFSIIPRGDTGGHVTYGEDFELLTTRKALETRLVVCMGGWAGVYVGLDGEENTGVSGDIQSATQVAYQMVTAYGMSRLGMFSLSGYPDVSLIPDSLKADIKDAVDELLAWAKAEALTLVQENVSDMRRLVAAVKEKETLIEQDFKEMFLNGESAISSVPVIAVPGKLSGVSDDGNDAAKLRQRKSGGWFKDLLPKRRKRDCTTCPPPAVSALSGERR